MYKLLHHLIFLVFATLVFSPSSYGQRILGISTNLFEVASLSPNLCVEIIAAPRSSFTLDIAYNPWKLSDRLSFRHSSLALGYNYWFAQVLSGHHIGGNISYTAYDVNFGTQNRYKGDLVGVGVTYGYSITLNRRWNLIPSVGVGVGIKYNEIDNPNVPPKGNVVPTLTKLGLAFQYIIN